MSKAAKSTPRVPVVAAIRLHAYPLIERAVEEGIAYGYRRAHKHGKPNEQQLRDAIEQAVMGELCELLVFAADTEDAT